MGSTDTKEKRLEKLRKKRIWPAIVMFIGVCLFCVIMAVAFVTFVTTYVVATKLGQMHEEAVRIGENMDRLLERGMYVQDATVELKNYLPPDIDLYVFDADRKPLAFTGESRPEFSVTASISLGNDYYIIGDSDETGVHGDGEDILFSALMEVIFKGAYGTADEDGDWLKEKIYSQEFWVQSPMRNQNYRLYSKQLLQIQRQDVFYITAFGIFALTILLLPIILLFINTIRAIVVQRKMTKLMYLDFVTGGWNWLYFQNTATRILTRHKNRRKAYAVVELHMEGYHNYCACYGVKAGEELLESMSGFLGARMEKGELHARYEGPDFALLLNCKGGSEQEYRSEFQKRVRSLLAELTGLRPEQKLHFHAGISMISPNLSENGRFCTARRSVDIDEIYNCANTARLETSCLQEQNFSFFELEMQEKQLWNRNVVENVETALGQEAFQVYLQPKYSTSDRKIVGAEALARWQSTSGEVIEPDRFIPIMEENGFITKLDDYMISHVAKLLSEWTIQGRKVVPVSINISKVYLSQEGLAEHICRLVDAYGPKHSLIELEVKESAFFEEKEILTDTVKRLKAYGFRVSLDDFGTGYSSLNSLKDMQLDAVKLDTGFFRDGNDSKRGEIIVREVVQLVRSLDMCVVAEGVEKKEQVDFLTELGCDMIQGFYFAKPMPVCEFEEKTEKDA